MKKIVTVLLILLSTQAFAINSRIRDFKTCTKKDTLNDGKIKIQVNYHIELFENCADHFPGVVNCREVRLGFIGDTMKCVERIEEEVLLTSDNEQIGVRTITQSIFNSFKKDCSDADIPPVHTSLMCDAPVTIINGN